MYAPLIILTFW